MVAVRHAKGRPDSNTRCRDSASPRARRAPDSSKSDANAVEGWFGCLYGLRRQAGVALAQLGRWAGWYRVHVRIGWLGDERPIRDPSMPSQFKHQDQASVYGQFALPLTSSNLTPSTRGRMRTAPQGSTRHRPSVRRRTEFSPYLHDSAYKQAS